MIPRTALSTGVVEVPAGFAPAGEWVLNGIDFGTLERLAYGKSYQTARQLWKLMTFAERFGTGGLSHRTPAVRP